MFDALWVRLFGHHTLVAPARDWIREHLIFLSNEFGDDRIISKPIIEPNDTFFPDRYDGSPLAVETLFGRICGYMDVSPEAFELRVFQDNRRFNLVGDDGVAMGTASGTYHAAGDRLVIRLNESNLHTPMQAVSTLSHELAHARLMGENRIDGKRWDNEMLTDLCAIYFGFGIFTANSPAYSPVRDLTWPGTEIRRTEYLSLPMITYALAMIADLRF